MNQLAFDSGYKLYGKHHESYLNAFNRAALRGSEQSYAILFANDNHSH